MLSIKGMTHWRLWHYSAIGRECRGRQKGVSPKVNLFWPCQKVACKLVTTYFKMQMGIFSGFGASKKGKDKGLKQVQGPISIDDPLDSELPNPLLVSEMRLKEASEEDNQGSEAGEVVENFENPCTMPLEDRSDAVDGSQNVLYQEFTLPSAEVCQIQTMTQHMPQQARLGFERIAGKIPELGCVLVELFEHFKAFEESAMICHGQHENMSALVEFSGRCLEDYGCTGRSIF